MASPFADDDLFNLAACTFDDPWTSRRVSVAPEAMRSAARWPVGELPHDAFPSSPLDRKSQPRYKAIAPAATPARAPVAGSRSAPRPSPPRSMYAALQVTPPPRDMPAVSAATRERIRATIHQRLQQRVGGRGSPALYASPGMEGACRASPAVGKRPAAAVVRPAKRPAVPAPLPSTPGYDEFFSVDAFVRATGLDTPLGGPCASTGPADALHFVARRRSSLASALWTSGAPRMYSPLVSPVTDGMLPFEMDAQGLASDALFF